MMGNSKDARSVPHIEFVTKRGKDHTADTESKGNHHLCMRLALRRHLRMTEEEQKIINVSHRRGAHVRLKSRPFFTISGISLELSDT